MCTAGSTPTAPRRMRHITILVLGKTKGLRQSPGACPARKTAYCGGEWKRAHAGCGGRNAEAEATEPTASAGVRMNVRHIDGLSGGAYQASPARSLYRMEHIYVGNGRPHGKNRRRRRVSKTRRLGFSQGPNPPARRLLFEHGDRI